MTLFARAEPPDAIFAVNDPVAIGAYGYLREAGRRIPGDVALVGFSNNPVSALIEPPLTTVSQPAYEMGQTAAGLLLKQLEEEASSRAVETRVLKTALIVRQST
jgi:LacI family transcriptional regulator